ncbi:MAG: DUF59 domain-containing protein [Spirochaetales bacterium]|nr:DUF59 domain-containing protein [Spirochaetales bacterium]
MTLYEKVVEKLKKIYDPEIPVDIFNLGLIYKIEFEECAKGFYCNILMTFTSPNCPVADFLLSSITHSLKNIDEIYKVEILVTFDPPWNPEMISIEGKEIFEMENIG